MVDANLGAAGDLIRINANEFRAKYKSKQECYNFLT